MATFDISKKMGHSQVLMVYLGDQIFGIPILQVQDVLGPQQITHVPLAPPSIRGVMNLRGRIVTAVDLRQAITPGEAPKNKDVFMSVVVEGDGELYSLIVDRVGDVILVENANVEDPPMTMRPLWRQVCEGVYQMKEQIMIILRTASVIDMAQV